MDQGITTATFQMMIIIIIILEIEIGLPVRQMRNFCGETSASSLSPRSIPTSLLCEWNCDAEEVALQRRRTIGSHSNIVN